MLASVISDPTAIIVVILPEVLVARDIEMIVRERRPKAHVLVARSLGEAMGSMPSGRIEVAFIQLDPRIVANSPLGHRISAEGGRVVLLERRTPDHDVGSPLARQCRTRLLEAVDHTLGEGLNHGVIVDARIGGQGHKIDIRRDQRFGRVDVDRQGISPEA